MRWGRALLIIVISLVTLIVVALALAPSILNLEQVKEQIVNRVEQQLNRDVELGQVRLEFFNGLGAGLDQLTIANPKGWQSPHFIKVDTLSVKVALRPLLSRKIEVNKIILKAGEIVVERDAQGHFNYDDLTAASANATTTEPAKPAPPDRPSPLAGFLVSKLALNNIDIKFIDRMVVAGETVTTAVRQANLEADNIGFNTPIAFNLSSALLTDGKPNLQVSGRIGPIPDDGSLDIQHIPLQLSLEATSLPLAPVVPYLGAQPMLTAGELGANLTIQGSLGNALQVKGQLALDKAVMPDTTGQRPPAVLPSVTLAPDLTVHLATALLTITDVQANLGALQTTLAGTVKQFDHPSPQLELRLNTSTFAIADVLSQWPMLAAALPDTIRTQGNVRLQATVKGTPERLHATSQLHAQPLSVHLSDGTDLTLTNVQLNQDAILDLAQSFVQLNQADLDLGFLRTMVQGTIANVDSTPWLDLRLNTSTFSIADVMSQLPMLAKGLPDITEAHGKIGLQATVKGTLERLHATSQLNARPLSVRLSDGTDLTLPNVQFDQDTVVDWAQSLITLIRTDLDLGFLRTTVQGKIANFDSTPLLEIYVKTSNFNPSKVFSHLPMLAHALPQPAEAQGDLELLANLHGPLDTLVANARVTAQALSLKSGAFHGGSAAQGGMRIDLSQMQTSLYVQRNAANPPTINVDVKAQHLVFDERSTSAPATSPVTTPPVAPPPSKAPPIKAHGNINIATGSIIGIAFRNLQVVFSLINGLLQSRHTVQMFGGAYHGTLTTNLAQAKPDYQLTVKLDNVQAGDVANTFTSAPNIVFGQLNTDLHFSGKGIDWNAISKTLTGTGKLNLTNFKLTTLDIMPKLAKGLSAASAIAGFTVPDDLSTRSFDKLKATLHIQNGKIRSDDLKLWGPDVQLLGKGLLGLDRSLGFEGTAVLLGKLAKSLGKRANFLLDPEGHVNIPLAIQGTVNQPRVALKENHLVDLARRALTQQVQEKTGKEVQKLLEKVLPGTSPDDKSEGSSEPVPEPIKEINKVLQGILNR